jgi:hypothetical protein
MNTWTKVEDPPTASMSANVEDATTVRLTATPDAPTPIPAGTDIGYQSVNGSRVESSTQGTYFSAASDFHVAVDYDFTAIDALGLAGIGFGIGEDRDGANSAGVGLGIFDGSTTIYAGAARINDMDEPPLLFAVPPSTNGRFFVRYDSVTGDVIAGVNPLPGSISPSETHTFSGIQNSWNDEDLLVSLFLRSDSASLLDPLKSGSLSTTFSNLEVLAGRPNVIPEPDSIALLFLGGVGLGLILWRSQRNRSHEM